MKLITRTKSNERIKLFKNSVSESVCKFVTSGAHRAEEHVGSPGAGATGSCDPAHAGTANWMLVLWKSSLLSGLWSQRFSPKIPPNLTLETRQASQMPFAPPTVYLHRTGLLGSDISARNRAKSCFLRLRAWFSLDREHCLRALPVLFYPVCYL